MNEIEAIKKFIKHVATDAKGRRYIALIDSKKGRKKFLAELYHGFLDSLREEIKSKKDHQKFNKSACYIYYEHYGFGILVSSFSEAYDKLSHDEGWVIVAQDASFGVYRPESEWDKEVAIKI